MRNQPSSRSQASDPSRERAKRSPVLGAIVMLTAVASTGEAPGSSLRAPQARQRVTASYGKLPLHFEANQGQTDERVKFLARGSGYGLFLTSTESVLVLRKAEARRPGKGVARGEAATAKRSSAPEVLQMKLLGADPRAAIEGREELPGKSHYFIGNDPKKWRTDVPQYARVEYKDVYPGVSLTYYGNQSQLEYDFVVSPGGDPGRIRLGIEGAEEIHVDAEGNLVLSLPGGEVVEKAPVVYQEVNGARKAVEGRFVLRGRAEVGFEVGTYEADRPLVLDPVLVYSTYLGGGGGDLGLGIAVDASGNAYITGYTFSFNFPTANPLQAAFGGGIVDAFVAKVNAAGSALVYSTYLGGSGNDNGLGIAVDASGNAYVTGFTSSTNFPTANPLQAAYGGGIYDAFVAKVNAAGSALVYSTYLGGSGNDNGYGIAVDGSGNAYVTGDTNSTNFPTANPLQAANGGGDDAFVAKVNAAGSALVYSTYLGGSGWEFGQGIGVDTFGNAYVTGLTQSTNFPTANPLQAAFGGGTDAFVAKVNAAGSALVYSTYLGGSAGDVGDGIAMDASGNAYVTGYTFSANFPTANPLQAANGGSSDAFVAKLNAAGSALVYSTYLGGSGDDEGVGIAVDASGNAYVMGDTTSTNFPTANPLQAASGGGYDAFVAKVNAAGSALVYSTYLGGLGDDFGLGIAVDASGNAYVTGFTYSTNFPTANPLQAANGGGSDAFVAKIGIDSSNFFTLTPCRVADTRNPVGPSGGPALAANATRTFPVTGICGIPSTASAVALNLTVVGETDSGDLRLYPAGSPVPSSSTINFAVQKVRANNAIIPLGSGGQIAVQCDMPPGSTGHTHFLFDVTGYFQ
jgi:hypothetical protein